MEVAVRWGEAEDTKISIPRLRLRLRYTCNEWQWLHNTKTGSLPGQGRAMEHSP